ncbi:voltage-gated potassium channel [Aureococcus anophagefferens]|uniref:Voltage-gated potassium channel n=1 Tax=Aureococcus anophagefferens TaxID=44056 RepID=A0ABR1GAM8_AURAN
MSMAFLETLIKWEESSPLDVARALREADAFAAHHEELARYARGLAGRIAQETGGFTGDEFSLDSSAPQSPTKDFPRSPPTPKRKAPLSPLAGGPLPLGLPPRRAGAAAGPNPYDLDSPDVASYASLEHRVERRASFDRCSEERASFERERRGSRRSDHDDALGAASRERRGSQEPRHRGSVGAVQDAPSVVLTAPIGRRASASGSENYVDKKARAMIDDRAQERARQRKVLTLNGGNVGEWLDYIRSAEDATPHELEMLQMRDDTWLDAALRVVFPVLSYNSSWLLFWQLAMVLCVVYVSVSVPIVIAWGTHALLRSGRCVRWMHHVDLFVDVFFLADIALTFFTSYVDEVTAEEVTDRRCIAYRYVFDPFAGKWIVFDAIASLPTSFFGCAGGGILEYVKFIRFTKLFKMLRMLKINSIVDTRHMPFFHPVMMRFMRILLGLLFVWHLFACLYWRVARSEEYWSTGCDPAAFSCWIPPKRVRDAPFFRQYSYAPPRVPRAYLWGSIHSFGSVFAVPTTTRTMWTTASVAIVGLVVNAIVIGSATNVLDGFHSIAKQHQKRKDGVNHYMRWQNFPPETLEMRMCLNRKIIDTQPLFWELGPKLMMVLVTALKAHITTPNETILREGDHGDLLFFLSNDGPAADDGDRRDGVARKTLMRTMTDTVKFVLRSRSFKNQSLDRVGVVHGDAYVAEEARDDGGGDDDDYQHVILLSVLKIGAVIGEIALLSEDEKRTASVLTTQHCELYSLDAENFNFIRSSHAEWHEILVHSAEQRVTWSKQMKALVNDDVSPDDAAAVEHANNFLAKRRATASRVVAPFHATSTTIKRDGQSHWDYMKQTKVAPTLSAAGDMLRNSSRGIDRVHRISREINDRLRSSSLRRSKNNGDATDGAAANGGTDALVDSAVRRMSKEPEPPRA